jgi:hypothetical protein
MNYLTLQDSSIKADVESVFIYMPLTTLWTCNIIVNSQTPLSGQATLSISGDSSENLLDFSLVGTIVPNRADVYLAQFSCSFVAGNYGIQKLVKPRSYNNAQLSNIINAIMNDCGETLDSSVSQSLLSKIIPSWTIISNKGSIVLRQVLEYIDPTLSWRFLPNGKLWFGYETWDQIPNNYYFNQFHQEPDNNIFRCNILSPYIVPGVNVPTIGNVNYVETHVTKDTIESTIFPDSDGE